MFFKHAYPAFRNNVISILITWIGVLQYFAGLLSQLKMASGQRLPTIWCDLMPQLNLKSYITNAILIRTTLEGIISSHLPRGRIRPFGSKNVIRLWP